jgi:hypothetical protein
MTRDEQEMALWRGAYQDAYAQDWGDDRSADIADRAVDQFRKRYPPAPPLATPSAAWYDEPPFSADTMTGYAWIEGYDLPCCLLRSGDRWKFRVIHATRWHELGKRKVSPLFNPPVKPPEQMP